MTWRNILCLTLLLIKSIFGLFCFSFSCVSFREILWWPACPGGFVFSIRKSKTKKWPSLLNDDCWLTTFISKKWKICDIHCSTRWVSWHHADVVIICKELWSIPLLCAYHAKYITQINIMNSTNGFKPCCARFYIHVKSAYEPCGPLVWELMPISVAWSD